MLDQPLIKVILLIAIVVVTVMLTRSTAGARHQAVRRILLSAFVALAVVAVLFPPFLTQVARAVGVGRGADLLLYGLTVTFLGYVAASYRRLREMEHHVTVLARELALRDPAGPAASAQPITDPETTEADEEPADPSA
ncbi:MAG: DUF2304 domain-containing protein [Ornithinimicrobium sp.]